MDYPGFPDKPARNPDNRVNTSGVRITAAKRRIEAMQLRQQGFTYKEIAERLGCSTQRAHSIVQTEFERLRAEQNELAVNILRVATDRVESLFKVYYQKAMNGDRLAADMVIKLLDRQARLFGLDGPKKVEATVTVQSDDPARLMAQAKMMGLDISDVDKGAENDSVVAKSDTGLDTDAAGEPGGLGAGGYGERATD